MSKTFTPPVGTPRPSEREPYERLYNVVDADGTYVSGPWSRSMAEELARRDWAAGFESYTKEVS